MNEQEELELLRKRVEYLEEQLSQANPKPKYIVPEYKYINEEKLNPPAYQPSKEEIELAKARFVMEEEIWSIIYYLEMYIKSLKGEELSFPYTKEGIEKDALRSLKEWNEAQNKWDDNVNIWDTFISEDWFQKAYVDNLSDTHSGDCTAFPASCMRCLAEDRFQIPRTATWGGKHEGHRLFSAYMKDVRTKNKTP